MSTVIGTLPERRAVEMAVDTLVANGFSRDSFGVLWRDKDRATIEAVTTSATPAERSSAGVEAGRGLRAAPWVGRPQGQGLCSSPQPGSPSSPASVHCSPLAPPLRQRSQRRQERLVA